MPTVSQQLVKAATEAGTMPPPLLNLGEQIIDPVTGKKQGVKSTGKHTVKFLGDKEAQGTDFHTKQPRDEVHYLFDEGGQKKRYIVSKYKKDNVTKQYIDEIHYFVVRMSEVEIGQTICLEMISQGGINFIQFSHPVEDIPIVEEDLGEDPSITKQREIAKEENENTPDF